MMWTLVHANLACLFPNLKICMIFPIQLCIAECMFNIPVHPEGIVCRVYDGLGFLVFSNYVICFLTFHVYAVVFTEW